MPSKLKSDSYDESFDLEQYEREGGNEDSQRIKRDDISGMRRGLLSYIFIGQMITSDRPGIVTKCEDGWVSDGDLLGMGCLWFEKAVMNYPRARNICSSMGSHMVEVHTRAQFNFVRGILKALGGNTWWAGATDEQSEGSWVWNHSRTPVQRWIWHSSQPSGDTKENGFCFHGPYNYEGADWPLENAGDGVVCQIREDAIEEMSDRDFIWTLSPDNKTYHP